MSQMLVTLRMSCDGEVDLESTEFLMSHCQEKLLARENILVPQTDTGTRVEKTKVSERTLVEELGKITP